MNVLILKEKYGDVILGPFSTNEEREILSSKIVKERLRTGWYFTEKEKQDALKFIDKEQTFVFLQSRNSYEYEQVYEETLTTDYICY